MGKALHLLEVLTPYCETFGSTLKCDFREFPSELAEEHKERLEALASHSWERSKPSCSDLEIEGEIYPAILKSTRYHCDSDSDEEDFHFPHKGYLRVLLKGFCVLEGESLGRRVFDVQMPSFHGRHGTRTVPKSIMSMAPIELTLEFGDLKEALDAVLANLNSFLTPAARSVLYNIIAALDPTNELRLFIYEQKVDMLTMKTADFYSVAGKIAAKWKLFPANALQGAVSMQEIQYLDFIYSGVLFFHERIIEIRHCMNQRVECIFAFAEEHNKRMVTFQQEQQASLQEMQARMLKLRGPPPDTFAHVRFFSGEHLSHLNGKPDGLPGVDAKFSTKWEALGCSSAVAVFAQFLQKDLLQFTRMAIDQIGMSEDNANQLSLYLESCWKSMTAVDSVRNANKSEAAFQNSQCYQIFRMSGLLDLWKNEKISKGLQKCGLSNGAQLMSKFLELGESSFESFIQKNASLSPGDVMRPVEVSARWITFISTNMDDVSLSDMFQMLEEYAGEEKSKKLQESGITRPAHLLGKFLELGPFNFSDFCNLSSRTDIEFWWNTLVCK